MNKNARQDARWRILKFLAARASCEPREQSRAERAERRQRGGMRNFGQESDAAAEITLLCMSCVDQARPSQKLTRSHLHYERAPRSHALVRDASGISIAPVCADIVSLQNYAFQKFVSFLLL